MLLGDSQESRISHVKSLLTSEKEKGTFNVLKNWYGEQVAIYGPGQEVVLTVERVAAPLFGVVSYAVQLIVYREDENSLSLWLARRTPTKWLYPNKLGVTVAGGIRHGESPFQCVVREAAEEASLPGDLISQHAISVGTVNYATATDSATTSGGEPGLIRAEVQYLYEMKVGDEVIPKPFDGEASDISLYTTEDVKRALAQREFTPGNACYVLAFLIRHGIVTFENEPNFTKIVSRLNRDLGVHTA